METEGRAPSAGQSHSVDDLLQFTAQSLSPRLLVSLQRRQDLVLVLGDVGVDLVEGGHAVELVDMETGLLSQIRAHVLV